MSDFAQRPARQESNGSVKPFECFGSNPKVQMNKKKGTAPLRRRRRLELEKSGLALFIPNPASRGRRLFIAVVIVILLDNFQGLGVFFVSPSLSQIHIKPFQGENEKC